MDSNWLSVFLSLIIWGGNCFESDCIDNATLCHYSCGADSITNTVEWYYCKILLQLNLVLWWQN